MIKSGDRCGNANLVTGCGSGSGSPNERGESYVCTAFYAATHKADLRNKMTAAINKGLPVFVTEYGICDASGNGAIDKEEANRWVQTMDEYGVSYIAWNLSNKQESSSIIKSSCSKVSGFKKSDLSDEGKWLYSMLRKKPA